MEVPTEGSRVRNRTEKGRVGGGGVNQNEGIKKTVDAGSLGGRIHKGEIIEVCRGNSQEFLCGSPTIKSEKSPAFKM